MAAANSSKGKKKASTQRRARGVLEAFASV